MAPTVQNGGNPADKRPQRPQEKKSELITRIKYSNTLPDIPFDLKFISYPFESDRFIQYNPTSLERNYKYDVLTEHDLGVNIDLINRELYQTDPYAQLDPADERLLEEDIHTTHQDSVRSRQHAKSVSWLRKSEYISTEKTRFQPQNLETVEAKVGYNVKASLREETLYMDRETQIQNIEKTFADSKQPILRHFSKPNVVAEEVLPLYPDFKNWKFPCAQVIFDADPAPMGRKAAQMEEMSQAMIRGVMDESGEQFVAYFLPSEQTMEKRRRDQANEVLYEEDEEYDYKMFREYNWTVKSKASKGYEENYFLVMGPDAVYYNELETRVRLSKRRQKAGQTQNNTKLVVKHRVLNANEHRMQRFREKQLEAPAEDDEDDMAADEEEDEPDHTITKTKAPEADADKTDKAEGGGDGEEDDKAGQSQEDADKAARKSRSRSRSGSRSGSVTHSDRSRSRSKSGSRSRSRSHSGSRRSKSGSRSRSGSRSPSRSRSRSGSRAASPHSARSGSASPRSRSGSPRSGSGSPRSKSGSPRSKSGSPRSRSGSRSRSRSRSGSPHSSGSGSRSPSRSRSGSPSGDSD